MPSSKIPTLAEIAGRPIPVQTPENQPAPATRTLPATLLDDEDDSLKMVQFVLNKSGLTIETIPRYLKKLLKAKKTSWVGIGEKRRKVKVDDFTTQLAALKLLAILQGAMPGKKVKINQKSTSFQFRDNRSLDLLRKRDNSQNRVAVEIETEVPS